MYPHRIRLRGPWEYERLDRPRAEKRAARERSELRAGGANPTGDTPLSGRVVLPCAPGPLAEMAGRLRFKRRFGYPGRIDAHERVWLIFSGVKAPVEIAVNGVALGRHSGDVEVDVSNLLQPRNEVTADVVLDGNEGLWDEAALEIRCTAYLRGVRVAVMSGRIHARGEVVGMAEGPLELYLIADRSPAGYEQVPPAGRTHPFDLSTDALNPEGKPVAVVKIDLVQGASVWYTVELEVPGQVPEGSQT
jgi:hypothetical protein